MAAKKKTKRETLVLLDAHAILHRAYHALPEFSSPKGEPTGALYGLVAMLLKIVEELKPDHIVACFDLPDPTYRHEAFKEYKAGRAKTDDTLVEQIDRSRDVFEAFGISIYEHSGFEADDILGTIVEKTKGNKNLDLIVASGDMDTLQLVEKKRVRVYTLKKGINDTVLYDEKGVEGRFQFGPKLIPDYKGLRGDPSDNIPGVRGIGDKTATELIVNFKSIEDIYKVLKKDEDKLRKAGIKDRIITLLKENEEEAVFSKMLATIRRDAPITFTLPKKTWREALDTERIFTLFAELGFRTLATRVKNLFELPDADAEMGEAHAEQGDKKIELALWLLSSDTTNPTHEDVMQYGRAHGLSTFEETKKKILSELKAQDLEKMYQEIELPLMDVLDEMHKTGIKIDTAYLKKLSKKIHTEINSIEKKIYKHAGTEFNINSPKQLGEVLYDTLGLKAKNQKKTSTGQRSTRESELEKLRGTHSIIEEVLRYREIQKLVSTYIDPIPKLVGKDGRLHTTFLQAGSTTGRMATQNPSIQNIPIRTEEGRAIRKAFVAEKGYTLVAMDYSQMELRVAAFLSGDKKLIEIFKNNEDVHEGVAMRMFNVSKKEAGGEMRRRAKIINFGILYGMGVNALRANLGGETTRAEAQEFLNAYFNTFTRLAEYLEETKAFARAHGYTKTHFGRRRHFPGINSSAPFIRAQAERMAINAPIQGTSADIIRIAMVRIHEYLKKEARTDAVRLMLQVHDELVFEIQHKHQEKEIPKIKEFMENVLSAKETRGVPIVVDVKVGSNWQEMKTL